MITEFPNTISSQEFFIRYFLFLHHPRFSHHEIHLSRGVSTRWVKFVTNFKSSQVLPGPCQGISIPPESCCLFKLCCEEAKRDS